jgi:hypothetical protein
MTQSRCRHSNPSLPCSLCPPSLEEKVGNALLASQLRGLPVLVGSVPQAKAAVQIREHFVRSLVDLRTFAQQLFCLPTHYWPLLRADQTFLFSLSQELRLIAERGDALLQEEVNAGFWVQHQEGKTAGVGFSQNQRTIALLALPRLHDVARYQPFATKAEYNANGPRKNPAERFYRQALPHTIHCLLEWLVDGTTISRWQDQRDAQRKAQEELRRAQQKKQRGGKRTGAGRPKGEPTRTLSLRIPESLYLQVAEQARVAELPLSVFLEARLEQFTQEDCVPTLKRLSSGSGGKGVQNCWFAFTVHDTCVAHQAVDSGAGGEGCDQAEANSDTPNTTCRTSCQPQSCGDGVTDTGENCDNGPLNGQPNQCPFFCLFP